MDYFTRAVEYILTEYVGQDNDKFRLNRLIWDEAVKYSGFTQALELISPGIIEP